MLSTCDLPSAMWFRTRYDLTCFQMPSYSAKLTWKSSMCRSLLCFWFPPPHTHTPSTAGRGSTRVAQRLDFDCAMQWLWWSTAVTGCWFKSKPLWLHCSLMAKCNIWSLQCHPRPLHLRFCCSNTGKRTLRKRVFFFDLWLNLHTCTKMLTCCDTCLKCILLVLCKHLENWISTALLRYRCALTLTLHDMRSDDLFR